MTSKNETYLDAVAKNTSRVDELVEEIAREVEPKFEKLLRKERIKNIAIGANITAILSAAYVLVKRGK